MLATCPAYLILLVLITLTILGEEYKPSSSSLCSFLQLPVTSSLVPVYYRAQKSAWMDARHFREWFHEEFVPAVSRHLKSRNLPEKALLVLDNALSHPIESELKKRKYKSGFLPTNVTSLIQPMNQGIIVFKEKVQAEICGGSVGENGKW
jgi:hypothetical protein